MLFRQRTRKSNTLAPKEFADFRAFFAIRTFERLFWFFLQSHRDPSSLGVCFIHVCFYSLWYSIIFYITTSANYQSILQSKLPDLQLSQVLPAPRHHLLLPHVCLRPCHFRTIWPSWMVVPHQNLNR